MPAKITIYHNPRCSKSRQTLSLLESKGITPEIIAYLDAPPGSETLRTIITALGGPCDTVLIPSRRVHV